MKKIENIHLYLMKSQSNSILNKIFFDSNNNAIVNWEINKNDFLEGDIKVIKSFIEKTKNL